MARSKVVAIQRECPATWEEALQQFLWWKQAQGVSKDCIVAFVKCPHSNTYPGGTSSAIYARLSESIDKKQMEFACELVGSVTTVLKGEFFAPSDG